MKPKKKTDLAVTEVTVFPDRPEPRVFSLEFKRAAVLRMRQGENNATALALELGIRRNLLYKWEKALENVGPDGMPRRRGRPPATEESELVRLRRELAGVKEELEILKKFDAYLAQLKK
jgi:transposase